MKDVNQDYIFYRIKKSKEFFEDAKLLAGNARWNSSINRLYYSTFYLISSLLFIKGIKATTHVGLKSQFNLHFVKKDLISKEFGKLYSNLFDWRNESDYDEFAEFDREAVMPLIEQVNELNTELLKLINELLR